MSNWKDVSSYSQSEIRSERQVKSVELRIGKVRLVVTRHIHYNPTDWVASFGDIYNQIVVGTGTLEDAKTEALILANQHLNKMITEISKEL